MGKRKFQTNIKYPAEARDNNIQGRVIVQFIVSKDGSIAEAKVVKSVHELLDQEALRMVSGMPNWTPGTHNGNAVRVAYSIPINFRIPDDEYHSISLYYYKEMQMMLFKSNTRPANQALNVSSGNLDNAIGELIRGQREFIEMDYTHDNYQNIQHNLQDHGIERIKYEVEKVQ